MSPDRKDVQRLTRELHKMKQEIQDDLDFLVDDDLIDEMKELGII